MPSIPPPSAPPETGKTRLRVRTPAGALALIPCLLGYRPSPGDLVILGTATGEDGSPAPRVRLTLRYDLPCLPDPEIAAEIARHAASVLAARGLGTAVAVGYGPAPLVTPAADALRQRAAATGLRITALLRADSQRYWSCLCTDPDCCPPEGTPYGTGCPEEAAAAGETQVLASREELAATLAPVTGADAASMRAATRRARARAARLAQAAGPEAARAAALDAVADAIRTYRAGGRFTRWAEPARLSAALTELRVRDDAWCRMDPGHRHAHLRLWTDLTRLARRGHVAPAASLLAFTAWQDGSGSLANIALDRALDDDPWYQMARLLHTAIDSGAPPSLARIPMTPEDVAAAYDEQDHAAVPA